MAWSTSVLVLIAGLLLQQAPPVVPSYAAVPKLSLALGTLLQSESAPRTKSRPNPKRFSCTDRGSATCSLALGKQYLQLARWDNALEQCATALAANPADASAAECMREAENAIQQHRLNEVLERLRLVDNLIADGAYSAAQDQLKAISADERRATTKYGPLDQAASEIRKRTFSLAHARGREWPGSLPSFAGIHDWLSGAISAVGRVLTFCILGGLLGGILYLLLWYVREKYRQIHWRNIADPAFIIRWSVSAIADDTKQSAAGALIDALNVDYNPLFQRLYTSSFLAAPPALVPSGQRGDATAVMFRNLFLDLLDPDRAMLIRPYLSPLIEALDMSAFRRHRFTQVEAYEDINLKLGSVVEASLGAIANTIRSWWTHGWPSVTGSVLFEDVDDVTFASVRLIANFGISRSGSAKVDSLRTPPALGGQDPQGESEMILDKSLQDLRRFFSEDRTLGVFASTQVDETADAIALASQRAAFRLLYRLARRPADPSLSIAASSYRQGIRLLNTVL